MNAIKEIEELKNAFVKLDNELERNAFMEKMKQSFDNKTESEKNAFIIAFGQSAEEACFRADSFIHEIESNLQRKCCITVLYYCICLNFLN